MSEMHRHASLWHCKLLLLLLLNITDAVTGRVFIHPGSINFDVGKFESGWMVYTDIVETSKLYVRESSAVPIYALLLFGGEFLHFIVGTCVMGLVQVMYW